MSCGAVTPCRFPLPGGAAITCAAIQHIHSRMACFLPLVLFLLLLCFPPACFGASTDKELAVVSTAWTTNALYVAFRVQDPDIVGTQTDVLGQPWQDDAVAIYLNFDPAQQDAALTERCLRVVISAAGGATVQRGSAQGWRDDPVWFDATSFNGTIRYGVTLLGKSLINDQRKTDEGYQIELGLSWKLLGITPPAPQNGELAPFGCALVLYSQGESHSTCYWPTSLTDTDLGSPVRWGTWQPLAGVTGKAGTETIITAPYLQKNIFVNGVVTPAEWGNAGTQILREKSTLTPPAPQKLAPLPVSIIAAWYQLDPFADASVRQPLEPCGPWAGPETPIYHQVQLREACQAGLDALAVVLPLDPKQRIQTRQRLGCLARALRDADASEGTPYSVPPLLLPVIDLSTVDALDLRLTESEEKVAGLLRDFYEMVPPQHRLLVQNGTAQYCSPVALTNPAATAIGDSTFVTRLTARLRATDVPPVGWLLDTAWNSEVHLPEVLSNCAFAPPTGVAVGRGPLVTAVIAPGINQDERELVPRLEGEQYRTHWQTVHFARPDFVLIRSWNDFHAGTEIAPSRSFGYRYVDMTQQAVLQLAQARGSGIGVLHHTLPAVLQPGRQYPVEVRLKLGNQQQITPTTSCQVDYRIVRKGITLRNGTLFERFKLGESVVPQLQFILPLSQQRRQPLDDGEYELRLEFSRSKVAILNSSLLRDKLGAVSIPFTISRHAEPAQMVRCEVPTTVRAGETRQVVCTVRNLAKDSWAKGTAPLRIRWMAADGVPLPAATTIPCEKSVETGDVLTVQSPLPPAPAQPGWYQVVVETSGEEANSVPLHHALVQVTPVDLQAEFRTINFPRSIEGTAEPVNAMIFVHNLGLTTWTKDTTRLTYQWFTWNGQAIPNTMGSIPLEEDVAYGGATVLRCSLLPPPGSGSFRCAFGMTHGEQAIPLIADSNKFVFPVVTATVNASRFQWVNLQDAYKAQGAEGAPDHYHWAATGDGSRLKADFDGQGRAFPLEEFLPDTTFPPLGYQPGYALGTPIIGTPGFHFPSFIQGAAPSVQARNQEIPLPKTSSVALHLVATSTGQPHPADFLVHYTDGTTQRHQLTVANWLGDPLNGEAIMLKSRHIHTGDGDDWTQHGSLFVYTLALDATRTPRALVLPDAPDLSIFAITAEHH